MGIYMSGAKTHFAVRLLEGWDGSARPADGLVKSGFIDIKH
jgi:hypothetical protein